MMNPNDFAFPAVLSENYESYDPGLTKREYFAAMAMQGFLSGPDGSDDADLTAKQARLHADALIAELNKEAK